MKTLPLFILIITILTLIFRVSLSTILNDELWSYVFIPPLIYFFLMYLSGWYFGKKEYEYLPIVHVAHLQSISRKRCLSWEARVSKGLC